MSETTPYGPSLTLEPNAAAEAAVQEAPVEVETHVAEEKKEEVRV